MGGEAVSRLRPVDGLPVGGHRLVDQLDPARVRHDVHQPEADVRAAYGVLGAGERSPSEPVAEQDHRFLVQTGFARPVGPLHEGFGVLGAAVPVVRPVGSELFQAPEHLFDAAAPPLGVRPGAPGQRRPQGEARAGREVAAGRGQDEALAEAVGGLLGTVGVTREEEAAAQRPQDARPFGGAGGHLPGEIPQQGDRGLERAGAHRSVAVPGAPGRALPEALREMGGDHDPAGHVVGGT